MRVTVLLAAIVAGSLGAGDADARPRTAAATALRHADRPVARAARVAQQPTTLELAIAAVQRAERTRAELVASRAALTRGYQDELAEIDRLKRQKASWRRDRALREKLASSLETAQALATLAERVKRASTDITRARALAVAAIDRTLPTVAGPVRADLERRRRAWAPPPAPSRRIVIPDDALDPLADPEELEQQAAALRESEAELGRELDRLDLRASRFDRMAAVRKQHDRAEELDRRDDADPRRVAVRTGEATADSGDDAAAPEAGAGGGSGGGGGGNDSGGGVGGDVGGDTRDLAAALADVVDPSTVDALRRAERSSDPSARAAAARRAREAVAKRLATLRQRRAAIEGRAHQLRADEGAR